MYKKIVQSLLGAGLLSLALWIIHQDLRTEIAAAALSVSEGVVPPASQALADTQRRIQANANPRLSLEALLIRLAAAMRTEA